MTDMFVLLQLPNAGDDLQAIKKGIVELADLVVDQQGRHRSATRRGTRSAQIASALAMLRPRSPNWQPPVLALSSALSGDRHRDILERGRCATATRCKRPASSPPAAAGRRSPGCGH